MRSCSDTTQSVYICALIRHAVVLSSFQLKHSFKLWLFDSLVQKLFDPDIFQSAHQSIISLRIETILGLLEITIPLKLVPLHMPKKKYDTNLFLIYHFSPLNVSLFLFSVFAKRWICKHSFPLNMACCLTLLFFFSLCRATLPFSLLRGVPKVYPN